MVATRWFVVGEGEERGGPKAKFRGCWGRCTDESNRLDGGGRLLLLLVGVVVVGWVPNRCSVSDSDMVVPSCRGLMVNVS